MVLPAVIKGGYGFGYISVSAGDDTPVMKTVYGVRPEKKEEAEKEAEPEAIAAESEEEQPEEQSEELPEKKEDLVSAEQAAVERARLIEEYEQLRERYEREAERYVLRAKEKAAEIYEKTKEMANKTIEEARAEAEQIKKQAAEEGKVQGHEEGYQQGHEEGYVNALKKCKGTLMELKTLSEEVTSRKEEIFTEYERALFDSVFEIAQKVTINSLKQKDKAVITRMLRAAAKRYRKSQSVKISLSQLDVSEEAEIDEALLKEVFGEGTLVEVEILKDAPQGTLLLDDGAEITDASVQTQLKMIEQLGKRKYRDKSLTDLLEAKREKPQDEELGDGSETENSST